MLPSRITFLHSERLSCNPGTNWRICPAVNYSGQRFWSVTNNAYLPYPTASVAFGSLSGDHFVDCRLYKRCWNRFTIPAHFSVVWEHHMIITDAGIHFIQLFLQGFQVCIVEFRVIAVHKLQQFLMICSNSVYHPWRHPCVGDRWVCQPFPCQSGLLAALVREIVP